MLCKIMIVGEAWGEQEERMQSPFVGPTGYELWRMLSEANIKRSECYVTNVFNLRPKPTNDIENLCCSPKPTITGSLPALSRGKYLRPEFLPQVQRLYSDVQRVRPNIIIALGNTACWALLLTTGISKLRGAITVTAAPEANGTKILPTYHPSAVCREWSLRPVTVLDFCKARRESEYPEIRRPERTVYIEPSLSDMEWFYDRHLVHCESISFDIETAGDQITCIGFAPNPETALVIPFCDPRKPGGSYWDNPQEEEEAWRFVRRVLAMPQPKSGQNGLYDITFLWRGYGITVTNYDEDTMLLHHALQPESPKGLGFLGSVYTNEASWKLMRKGKETIKRED